MQPFPQHSQAGRLGVRKWGVIVSRALAIAGLASLGRNRRLPATTRLQGLLNGCSEILFLKGSFTGLIVISVTLLNPAVGIAGLVSVAAALLFGRLAEVPDTVTDTSVTIYNALLTGLCVGLLFGLQPLGLLVAATAGVLVSAFTVALNGVFTDLLKLPVLSLPFVIVSSGVWLSFTGTGHSSSALGIDTAAAWHWLPHWLEGMLTSLGALVFTPHPAAGLVLAILILRHSRILFGLAVSGYLLGASVSRVLAGDAAGFSDINYFNHMLVAMSLGGVFLVPSLRSYSIATIAVIVSALLLSAMQVLAERFGVPVFTMPFNVVTLTFLYFLGRSGSPQMAHTLHDTPEQTLDHHLSHRRRFGDPVVELSLPFSGNWTLWQGFNGPWTHTGPWQHACDFIITRTTEHAGSAGAETLSYSGNGQRLEDYHAWRKPVLAPCSGRVVRVVSGLRDNPPGHVDSRNHWGNLVIIESPLGWFAELSHFARDSVAVREGEQVEVGQLLGLCGNSGYSAQPHIHLQIQASPHIGAATLAFRFVSFLESNHFTARGLPSVGREVQPLLADRNLGYRTALPLGEVLRYRVVQKGASENTLILTIGMDDGGRYFLESTQGRLYFTQDPSGFYFYRMDGSDPWLAVLFQALPHLPLGYAHGMTWSDSLPLAVIERGWRHRLVELSRTFLHRVEENRFVGGWVTEDVVEGQVSGGYARMTRKTRVVLSQRIGFSEVQVGDRTMFLEGEQG